jgi:hypothetical protein
MALKVKVTHEDFDLSTPFDSWVDGLVKGQTGLWVYVELGEEQEYIPRPKDNPKTDFRLFTGCDVYYGDSQEQLEAGNYKAEEHDVTVIIYC